MSERTKTISQTATISSCSDRCVKQAQPSTALGAGAQPIARDSATRRARRTRWTAAARARRGTSVVEFAVIAPVFFLLVFGIIEFGRLMMVRQAMTNAAREAGRKASLATTLNAADVDLAARNFMKCVMDNASDAAKVRITTTPASLSNITSGTPVTVAVAVNFADVGWLPQSLLNLSGSRELNATSTFYRE